MQFEYPHDMTSSVENSPKFAILGAGALGSILGAHLVRAGHSVVMLVRERRAQQIREGGLRVKGLVDFQVGVPVLTDASQLRKADVLVVAMKTTGTAAALQPLRDARIGAAFSVQNGVFKDDELVDAFGRDRVLGSLANTSGELLANGDALFTRNVDLQVGELTGGLSPRAKEITSIIDAAGVRSSAVPDIVSLEWSKFAVWASYMPLSVATRSATWKYLLDPDIAIIVARVVREIGAMARAQNIALSDDSMLPVRSMCEETEDQAVRRVLQAGETFRTKAPEHRMSSLQDFNAGRPLELEDTIGRAVRKAAELGVAIPVAESLYRLVRGIEKIEVGAK
jgi:2-dehydropantoate 2-reductase